ncbi:lysozyme [Azospirillum argentinense]
MPNVPSGAAMPREIHPDALALVRHFEGLYLSTYLCPAGVPTIGYGHTAGVRMGQTIDGLQAEVFLRADMADAAAAVDRLVKVPLTDRQRGALASFVFNLGAGTLRDSTLLRLLNQRDYEGAAGQFGRWVFATVDGVKTRLPGLVKRRAAESLMFEKG